MCPRGLIIPLYFHESMERYTSEGCSVSSGLTQSSCDVRAPGGVLTVGREQSEQVRRQRELIFSTIPQHLEGQHEPTDIL